MTVFAIRDCKQVQDILLECLGRKDALPRGTRWNSVEAHVNQCSGCKAFAAQVIKADIVKQVNHRILAGQLLVRHTQLRVRQRAEEIREYRERMWPVWLSSAMAGVWGLASIPFVWQGAEWLGKNAQAPAYVWQPAAVLAWFMPMGLMTAFALYMKGDKTIFGEAETE
jgi:hypothetical protein